MLITNSASKNVKLHEWQDWLQSDSNSSQMGQIMWDFFRWDSSTFRLGEPKCTDIWSEKVPDLSHLGPIEPNVQKSDLKKCRICPIWGQSAPLWAQIWSPWTEASKETCWHCIQSAKTTQIPHMWLQFLQNWNDYNIFSYLFVSLCIDELL